VWSEVTFAGFIGTALAGILCGSIIGFYFKRPKSGVGLAVTIVLCFLGASFIPKSLISEAGAKNPVLVGMQIDVWLSFLGAAIIAAYVVRLVKERRRVEQG
jgi:FtsH-binding integral membrane protein